MSCREIIASQGGIKMSYSLTLSILHLSNCMLFWDHGPGGHDEAVDILCTDVAEKRRELMGRPRPGLATTCARRSVG